MLIASLLLMSKIAVGDLSKRPCLPNGCYYDLENGLTKQIQCMKDGTQEIIYFSGHNGCEFGKNLIPELFYKSSIDNPCCMKTKPNKDSPAVYPACNDNLDCAGVYPNEYCLNGQCAFNRCHGSPAPEICLLDNPNTHCSEGCACSVLSAAFSVNIGICVPAVNDEDQDPPVSSTSYSVTIENISGKDQTIAIFEKNPTPIVDGEQTSGYPVVFAAQAAEDGGSTSMRWSLDWGLSWSTGDIDSQGNCQALTSNIIYSQKGHIVSASPQIGDNGASVTFNNQERVWDISSHNYPAAQPGSIYLETDDSFTNAEALNKCFSLCVMMGTTPIFAIDGEPNTKYDFPLKPTYYLTIIDQKEGDTVSATVISEATQIVFEDGEYNIQLCLSGTNKFISCPQMN